jgi:transcriptional regulator GlxA family with amidase domain
VDLISHAPGLLAEAPAERAKVSALLSMMLDYIDRHSDDPDLGATTLAAKLNCSPRYVHRLFAGTGRSVGEHVNEKRILVCTRNLLDRTGRRRSIAEIAFAAGFRDVRTSTACSTAAMTQPRASFAGLWPPYQTAKGKLVPKPREIGHDKLGISHT